MPGPRRFALCCTYLLNSREKITGADGLTRGPFHLVLTESCVGFVGKDRDCDQRSPESGVKKSDGGKEMR